MGPRPNTNSQASRRPAVYGRRRGHRLRPGRRALIERLLPAVSVELPREGAGLLDLDTLFGASVEGVWLEVGFGAGEHLAFQAKSHPEVGFIGCEAYINGIAGLLRHIDGDGLSNIRIFADDARLLLATLPETSVGRAFVLFPDPWPKTKHHKRRLITPANLDLFARALKSGAELRLATDHAEYLRWMLSHLTRHPAFRWRVDSPKGWRERPADWPETRYERKARAEGRACAYLRFTRVARES